MTKFTKLIAAVAMLWLISAQATPLMAYDFKVGQLYYKVTDAAKREVAVVSENSSYPYYNNAPTGTITIPATEAILIVLRVSERRLFGTVADLHLLRSQAG